MFDTTSLDLQSCDLEDAIAALYPEDVFTDEALSVVSSSSESDLGSFCGSPCCFSASSDEAEFRLAASVIPQDIEHNDATKTDGIELCQMIETAQVDVQGPRKVNRRPWSRDEHERFVEAVRTFSSIDARTSNGRVYVGLGHGVAELIAETVGTRTVAQVRSHAQKFFLRQLREPE
ncbi:hypothetical protein GUITHDRAFT_116128 [Guillardia theta CCMP2712]|uniref:Myb-like domain-containing protein n=1 Tax=Guillardia theta (strain CCMP2712) TaxID=905079 RepID=L1IPA4_GUITC|nr:hypothetical protein GUITHDRAFT_116128 [Guillardia theta CCMP2712]EKX37650.1 hypothetical protein GUITHDRAFT_116128 [Guillardia theta CCMP2712]|eukprot:XP_005824630.1 hypothetical protein GUITHDRAFT_116128 [Guillardia theta CCMP2712]